MKRRAITYLALLGARGDVLHLDEFLYSEYLSSSFGCVDDGPSTCAYVDRARY